MSVTLSRRRLFGLTVAASCPFCTTAWSVEPTQEVTAHPPGAPPHWGYAGDSAPDKWGQLSAEFKTCALGSEQTPIDLRGAIKAPSATPIIGYQKMPLTILNNGHTIQVNTPPGSRLDIAGTIYELAQFHFHHPSEHLLAGRLFAMELHLVHTAASGALAVVGVFIQPGTVNSGLAPIWAAMPSNEASARVVQGVTIDPSSLLPKAGSYYRYMGSLTTPPCSEGLTWTVFRTPIEASPEQIRQFAALFPHNARPIQPLNRRLLLES